MSLSTVFLPFTNKSQYNKDKNQRNTMNTKTKENKQSKVKVPKSVYFNKNNKYF